MPFVLTSPLPLAELIRLYAMDRRALLAALQAPALVSNAPVIMDDDDDLGASPTMTLEPIVPGVVRAEPLLQLLRKDPTKQNAFAMGVTIGRLVTNDVVLDHASVSRFHAWFQLDARRQQWMVTDAGSDNGTFVAGRRLTASQPVAVHDGDTVAFGAEKARFFLPQGLLTWVEPLTR